MNAQTPFDVLIDAVADRVVEKLAPIFATVQPDDGSRAMADVLWDARQVREHLGIADRTLGKLQNKAGFPRRQEVGGDRRWIAGEIIAYGRANPKRSRK
jgi:predicted DNA-binding transcriptional regulator AlpA